MQKKAKKRCPWAGSDPLYRRYHDREWGVPEHRDRQLFELLTLEGAQAGLSWLTVLRKRQNYRKAFDAFDFDRVSRYDGRKRRILMGNAGIIRNRLKIASTVENARAVQKIRKEFGTFDRYLWQLAGGKPKRNRWRAMRQLPSRSEVSDHMSRELKRRGFRFIGSTICYALMQATGMVNDHLTSCFRYKEIKKR